MILAGDVGGTKTLIGLFEYDTRRPVPVDVRSFPTIEFAGLPEIIEAFFAGRPSRPSLRSAAFGVAGPVINQFAKMTNVAWHVDAAQISQAFSLPHVRLLNDLEAMAYSLPVLEASELKALQAGTSPAAGNVALIAAGTGLGEALLHRTAAGDIAIPSEGGHSDFAPRSDRELALACFLRERYGRAEIEHVLSGPGIVNLSNFTHHGGYCETLGGPDRVPSTAAAVAANAMAGTCDQCKEALDLFVSAYGAAAGNLALTVVSSGGLFIGGGIAPRLVPFLENGLFIKAFNDKGPMRSLLEAIPVHVIMNPQAALLGAAVSASRLQ